MINCSALHTYKVEIYTLFWRHIPQNNYQWVSLVGCSRNLKEGRCYKSMVFCHRSVSSPNPFQTRMWLSVGAVENSYKLHGETRKLTACEEMRAGNYRFLNAIATIINRRNTSDYRRARTTVLSSIINPPTRRLRRAKTQSQYARSIRNNAINNIIQQPRGCTSVRGSKKPNSFEEKVVEVHSPPRVGIPKFLRRRPA